MAHKKKLKKGKGGYLKYKNESRREKNKVKKVLKHLRRFAADLVAVTAVEKLKSYRPK
jgi:hypothetical protein